MQIGEPYWSSNTTKNKLSTPFISNPYKKKEECTVLTAKRDDGHSTTRNSSFYKLICCIKTIKLHRRLWSPYAIYLPAILHFL